MPPPYYIKKQAGFFEEAHSGELNQLFIYQPTPEGIEVLCQHYSEKYKIKLQCIDCRNEFKTLDDVYSYFFYLQSNPEVLQLEEGEKKGLIFSHGQNHAVPVVICKKDGVQSMIVLDSSVGNSIKGYYRMAALFPEFNFYVNQGTRQSDGLSCITDAVCILKEALQIEELVSLVDSKKLRADDLAYQPNRFFSGTRPERFNAFKMPEQLLVTAQVSRYLEQAGADDTVMLRGKETLAHYRERFRMSVVLLKDRARNRVDINGYLFVKSIEHRNIFDYLQEQEQKELEELQEINGEIDPRDLPPSPYRTILSPSRVGFNQIVVPGTPHAHQENYGYRSFSR